MLFFARKTDYDGLAASTAAYHANIAEAEPICGMVNKQTRGSSTACCSYDRDDRCETWRRARPSSTRCTVSTGCPKAGGRTARAELRTSGQR